MEKNQKEVHLCRMCGEEYGLSLLKDTLVVITTNNGKAYLEELLPGLNYDYVVIDTGSTEKESIDYFNKLKCKKVRLNGGYCVGAYIYAYKNLKDYDSYFFMHDSMMIKDPEFLDKFRPHRE